MIKPTESITPSRDETYALPALRRLLTHGVTDLSGTVRLDEAECAETLHAIRSTRPFDPSLFVPEPERVEDIQFRGVNPRVDHQNLLLALDTDFVEAHPGFRQTMSRILGPGYHIKLKKIVCGLPDRAIPPWVLDRVRELPVPNLGPYVREEYRDITYFRGIDWHQDIIDYPASDGRFLTVYVYLDTVSEADAPLCVVPRSHLLGATRFPHVLQDHGTHLHYRDPQRGNCAMLEKQTLTGRPGSIFCWHSQTLHGTDHVTGDIPRLSLRYLIERDADHRGFLPIDFIAEMGMGQAGLPETRNDVDPAGKPLRRGNVIKGIG